MVKLSYKLSKSARDEMYISTGKNPPNFGLSLEVADEDLTPEQRRIVAGFGIMGKDIYRKMVSPNTKDFLGRPQKFRIGDGAGSFGSSGEYEFDHVPTVEEWFTALETVQSENAALEAQRPALESEYAAMLADWQVKEEERKASEAHKAAEARAEREQMRRDAMTIPWDA